MAQLSMSASARSTRSTPEDVLDTAVEELQGHARQFARLAPSAKAGLVRACIPRAVAAASTWAARGAQAKDLPAGSAEEWLAGPLPTVRHLRLLADALDAVAARRPPLGTGSRERSDGRLQVDLLPASRMDRVLWSGVSAYALMQAGVDRHRARDAQASFYGRSDPDGGVCLVLGAGNVSSIPPTDVLSKMFNDGLVCLLKVNPVNEWVGPVLERVLQPLIAAGFLRVVYGGADVGRYLARHGGIDAIHLTGSVRTHDAMVWGEPGPEQDRRRAAGEPLLTVPLTSELGNITPVAVVPYRYSRAELAFQARNVATMVTNNASFNCLSVKMLVTARDWPQRDEFLRLVAQFLARTPNRVAYYPGAADRYDALTHGRSVQVIGNRSTSTLPWTVVPGLDAGDPGEPLFRIEPFCPLLPETAVGSSDPVQFLRAAGALMNGTIWGTLCACLVVHPRLEHDPEVAAALEQTITDLRYGTVSVNHWPALSYGLVTPPWGGHPSASLQDVQSGIGWVHNPLMLDLVDKTVLRGPIRVRPTPVWFSDHPKAIRAAPDLIALEARPRWSLLPRVMSRLV